MQGVGIFLIVQFAVSKLFGGGAQKATTSGPGSSSPIPAYDARPDSAVGIENYNPIPQIIAPIWPMDSSLDVSIYVSPSIAMPALSSVDPKILVLEERGFTLGDWKDSREIDTTFDVPIAVQNNGTLWTHFYVALHGYALDPASKDYDVAKAYHFFRPLNLVLPKKKVAKTRSLLSASNDTQVAQDDITQGPAFASYYHPNFTMSFIPDSGTQSWTNMHPALRQYVHLESTGARDASGQNGWYYPVLFVNTFWQLRDHMTELNSTVKTLPLHITLNNMNNWKYSIFASIDDSVKQNQKQAATGVSISGGGDGSEFEEFKRILIDTNVYLLSTTAIVTVLHMVFEMLAFKSDLVGSSCP